MHDAAWHEARRQTIGGSDAKIIMEGTPEELNRLRAIKRGEIEDDILDDVLQVQLGSFTEPFNLMWFEKQTGLAVDTVKDRIVHPLIPFMSFEPDGQHITEELRYGIEAKHVSAFAKPEEIVTRYYWQCQHQMACASYASVILSVIFGNHKWDYFEIHHNRADQLELEKRCKEFWHWTQNDLARPLDPGTPVQVSLDDMREADMTGNNQWADAAAAWLECKPHAKTFNDADKVIKNLVDADVKLASGHGIKVSRAKNGSLRIQEAK